MFYTLLYIAIIIAIASGVIFKVANKSKYKWLLKLCSILLLGISGYIQWIIFRNYESLFLIFFEALVGYVVASTFNSKEPLAGALLYLFLFLVLSSGIDYLSQKGFYIKNGNVSKQTTEGSGTFEDPFIVKRSTSTSELFDQKVNELYKKGKIIETKENQLYGGILTDFPKDQNQEINITSIYYFNNETLIDFKGNYNADPASNPIYYHNYLGDTITKKDFVTFEEYYDNYQGMMLVNYIIQYEDQWYQSTMIKKWDGYEEYVSKNPYTTILNVPLYHHYPIKTDVYIYDFYQDATYIQNGGSQK